MGFHKVTSVGLLMCYTILLISACISAKKRRHDQCTQDAECETGHCDRVKRTCECGTLKSNSGKKVEQLYDSDLRMCLSRVGQTCIFEEGDNNKDLTHFSCIPDAKCSRMSKRSGQPSPDLFGQCECKTGFQSADSGRKCISNVELRTVQSPSSMNHVRQEGWNRSGSNSNIFGKVPYILTSFGFLIIVRGYVFAFG